MLDLVPADAILAIALLLGFAAGTVALVLLLKRAPKTVPGLAKSDRFGTAFTAAGAIFVGITAWGNAIATVVASIAPGSVTVYDLGRNIAEVDEDLMALPHIEHASSTGVDVTITDAPPSIAAWQLGADLLPILLVLIVCAAAVWLAVGTLKGTPFGRRFPIALVVVASAVMVCGLFANLCRGISLAEAALFLNSGAPLGDEPFAAFFVTIDLSPIGWGLVIGLVAGAFQIGTRMQQDTKGLV